MHISSIITVNDSRANILFHASLRNLNDLSSDILRIQFTEVYAFDTG